MFEVFDRATFYPDERRGNITDDIQRVQQMTAGRRDRWAWLIDSYYNDYTDFEFDFEPKVLDQCYAFPTQHQARNGTYFIPKGEFRGITSVNQPGIVRKTITRNWHQLWPIRAESFDWLWTPDDLDPPYIHVFASQHQRDGLYFAHETLNEAFAVALKTKTNLGQFAYKYHNEPTWEAA